MPSLDLLKKFRKRSQHNEWRNNDRCSTCSWPSWHDAAQEVSKSFDLDQETLTAIDLVKSGSKGCLGCLILVEAFKYLQAVYDPSGANGDQAPLTLSLASPAGGSEAVTIWYDGNGKARGLHITTSPGSPPIPGIACRSGAAPGDTGPVQSVPRIQAWLEQCQQQHKTCNQSEPYFPPRVLDVLAGASRQEVQLVEISAGTVTDVMSYACLSHCWGQVKNPHLTKVANLEKNRRGIPVTELPLTFQHAIEMTERLGLRYLWIDSLCIVQDDEQDWLRHVSSMADIYRHAFLTLAAGASQDGSQGLFRNVEQVRTSSDRTADREVNLPHGGTSYRLSFFSWLQHGYEFNASIDAHWPLMQRGWVFQEHMLSRRFITFAPTEVTWVCRATRHCECESSLPLLPPTAEDFERLFFGDHLKMQIADKLQQQGSDTPAAIRALWCQIVENYTNLRLSFAKDKLPAIAGIAALFNSVLDDQYVAGHWVADLAATLAWQLSPGGVYARMPTQGRARDRGCPSWAWPAAADDGYILMDRFPPEPGAVEIVQTNFIHGEEDRRMMLTAGSITVRGVLLPISILFHDETAQPVTDEAPEVREDWRSLEGTKGPSAAEHGQISARASFNPDLHLGNTTADVRERTQSLRMLLVSCSADLEVVGLVLVPSWPDPTASGSAHPCFERIGHVRYYVTQDGLTVESWGGWRQPRTTFNLV